tara:strand:- start:4990 stop:5226 length:237 start_codon:yes stop_codon:yes gene_type:complete
MATMDDVIGYLHCRDCAPDKPEDLAPRQYIHIEIGITQDNILVVNCVRCEKIVGTLPLRNDLVNDLNLSGESCECCEL